jgi:hypothetical protein
VGFGGECGGSRAARADGTGVWVWNRRTQQLARMERDLGAHSMALGTADAKWVNRQEHCLTQPRATISMSMKTGGSCRAAPGPRETPSCSVSPRRPGFFLASPRLFPDGRHPDLAGSDWPRAGLARH